MFANDQTPAAQTIALIDPVPVFPAAFAVESRAAQADTAFPWLKAHFVSGLKTAGIGVFTYTAGDPHDIA
jgi:hypothetical protein